MAATISGPWAPAALRAQRIRVCSAAAPAAVRSRRDLASGIDQMQQRERASRSPHLADFLLEEATSRSNAVPWTRPGSADATPPARIADAGGVGSQASASSSSECAHKAASAPITGLSLEDRRARQQQLYAALRRMSAEGAHDKWVHSGIAAALASADPRAAPADVAGRL